MADHADATKYCARCDQTLPVAHFALRDKVRGKHQAWCRMCMKIVSREFYKAYKEKVVARRNRNRKAIMEAIRVAKERPCADCGVSYPYFVMDLDHRPGEKKSFRLSLAQCKGSLRQTVAELAKCDVVCANCHRLRTFGRLMANGKVREREHYRLAKETSP